MNLESIAIQNFRSFVNSQFEFNSKLNLIIGNNGSGKSSLLYAIVTGLGEPMRILTGEYLPQDISKTDVRFEMQLIGRRVRFENRYPATLDLKVSVFGEQFEISIKKTGAGNYANTKNPASSLLREKMESIDLAEPYVLPIVAFYRSHRNMAGEKISLERAASEKISRRDGYKYWTDALVSQQDLEKWVIGKTLERLAGISDGETAETVSDDELSIVNKAITDCIPGCRGLGFDLRLRSLMVEFGGENIPFDSLSDGQKAVVALIADIARRMCILNPHLDRTVLERPMEFC